MDYENFTAAIAGIESSLADIEKKLPDNKPPSPWISLGYLRGYGEFEDEPCFVAPLKISYCQEKHVLLIERGNEPSYENCLYIDAVIKAGEALEQQKELLNEAWLADKRSQAA
jgi:hypothetical protein